MTVVGPMPLLVASVLLAGPAPADLETAWRDFVRDNLSLAHLPALRPSAEDWREIAGGEVIKYTLPARDELTPHMAALGYIDQPVESVWLALLDGMHLTEISEVRWYELPESTRTHRVLYQHLDLPVPFTDRHWLIHVVSNGALHKKSAARAWERTWSLDPEGEASLRRLPAELRAAGDGAIFTPANEGGWFMLRAGFGTLVIYHLRTHIGGYIPPALVASFAKARFDELIETVADNAGKLPGHYRGVHLPIYDPSGAALPRFGE